MANYAKDIGPKTTIWKEEAGGTRLLKTLPGLPFGVPTMGHVQHIPEFGAARCSGVQKSGTAPNETVAEVRFTVK